MDCNIGRFSNSNFPLKSWKLFSPIPIDFDHLFAFLEASPKLSSQSSSFSWVNKFLLIFRLFYLFYLSIWNVLTNSKQSSPISTDSKFNNKETSQSSNIQLVFSFKCFIPVFIGLLLFPSLSISISFPLYQLHYFTNFPSWSYSLPFPNRSSSHQVSFMFYFSIVMIIYSISKLFPIYYYSFVYQFSIIIIHFT